jgi:hypothetical protein
VSWPADGKPRFFVRQVTLLRWRRFTVHDRARCHLPVWAADHPLNVGLSPAVEARRVCHVLNGDADAAL